MDPEIRRNREGAKAIGLCVLFLFGMTAILSLVAHGLMAIGLDAEAAVGLVFLLATFAFFAALA